MYHNLVFVRAAFTGHFIYQTGVELSKSLTTTRLSLSAVENCSDRRCIVIKVGDAAALSHENDILPHWLQLELQLVETGILSRLTGVGAHRAVR